jgi:hypothetical protein
MKTVMIAPLDPVHDVGVKLIARPFREATPLRCCRLTLLPKRSSPAQVNSGPTS